MTSIRGELFLSVIALSGLALSASAAIAQQGPVAAFSADERKRNAAMAPSFATTDVPPAKSGGVASQVYLIVGDLERAFDAPRLRAEGAIVPTNTDLSLTAAAPATQRVLIERVQKQPAVMRDLEEQIAARRKQPAAGPTGLLGIGVDSFVAQLPRQPAAKEAGGAFPRVVCLIATDFAQGGAIDRRELFAQERMRKGIAGCLAALDAAGVQSVVLPLMGAASSGTQAKDAVFEGQRVLKECRLMNSLAGIALGIHDFAPGRRQLREIGIIQWDQELAEMFGVRPGTTMTGPVQNAYRTYTQQIALALRRGVAGEKTTASDIDGSCNAIFNAQ